MSEGAPVCRWVHQSTVLDVMPLDATILGFSNRWYGDAMKSATLYPVSNELSIRMITAPLFIATKFKAFKSRGKNDYFGSADLEDIISVIDGRETLLAEAQMQEPDLRKYLRVEATKLLLKPQFIDALPGHLLPDSVSQARVATVFRRLEELARLP